jgi:2-phospho-L-lactate guanylyltransferase (CobY/MobA/RfbA family)
MEYLLVIGLTLLSYWSIIKISNKRRMIFLNKNKYRQSSIYEMVKDVVPKQRFDKPKVITQSQRHIQKNMLRVVIADGSAYWILNNVFYTANAVNGRVDEETIKPLDIENMPTKELDKMLSILDDLKQGVGPNDSGGTGNKRI